ncbi:8005_t:CDS:2 [Gigaspora rosea]|nr:8005_t:CDS:2 [Gigaspora rosea]
MGKERTGKEAVSYMINEHVKYLERHLKRLEVNNSNAILLDFVRNELKLTKQHKDQIDNDYIKMVGNLKTKITNQANEIQRLKEKNNGQEDQIKNLEYQLMVTIERFRNEREYEEVDETEAEENVWIQNAAMSFD